MCRTRGTRGALSAVLLAIGFITAACNPVPGPTPAPTEEPVQPRLPTATPVALATAAAAPSVTPAPLGQAGATPPASSAPTVTPVPLGQAGGDPQPVGSPPTAACPAGSQAAARLPGVRLGVNIAPGDQPIEQPLGQASEMSAEWVRATLRWSDLEPQKGAYRWEALDALAGGAQARGLRVLLSVTTSPGWATAGGSGGLPDAPEDFGAFMAALASRAKGKIGAYEIWQAPNTAAANGGTTPQPGQYVEVLKAAYGGVKSADPCALVLNGALQPNALRDPKVAIDDLSFYRGMLTYNGGEVTSAYDILAVRLHTSGVIGKGKWPREYPAQSRGFYGHVEGIYNNMLAGDEGEKQVWVVQIGYQLDGATAVTPEQQAEYLAELFPVSRKAYPWISAIFVRDLGGGAGNPEPGYALYNPDGTPRPAVGRLRGFFKAERARRDQVVPIKNTDLVQVWAFWPNIRPIGQLTLGPDGTIYTRSDIGFVRGVDPNGAFRMSVKPGRKSVFGVAIDGRQRIYASSESGTLAAFGPGGEPLWNELTDGTLTTPLLVSPDGQALYAGSSRENLDAYAAADGHKLWGTPLGGIPGTPALGSDGTIYVGSTDGVLHAIGADGTSRWSYAAGAWVPYAPIVEGGTLYGFTNVGTAFALELSGALRWQVDLGAEPLGMAAGPDGLYISTVDGVLHALTRDGQVRWKTGLDTRPTAPATGADGRIYLGGEDGALRVVNPDGTVAGSFGFDVPIRVPPLAGPDGAVYVALGDGQDYLIAFGKPELKERYNVP